MSDDDPRHGTVAGYIAHGKSGTPSCEACTTAIREYERSRQTRRYLARGSLVVDGNGTRRRLRALVAIGWPLSELDRRIGRKRSFCYDLASKEGDVLLATASEVAALYDDLSMTAFDGWLGDRQRRVAQRRGWLPPLAWDNIDDPNEAPDVEQYRPVIQRHADEMTAEWDHLRSLGVSIHQAAKQLGVTVAAIEKATERAKGSAA